MPLLSEALLLAFLIVVFPLRSLRRRHKFGSAERASYGRGRPPVWWTADLLFLVGFGLVIAGPILRGSNLAEVLFDPGPATLVLASVGLLLATCLAVWCQETMGAAWRPDIGPAKKATLVTTGPFRFVRNPTYVAMLAAALCATSITPTVAGTSGLLVLLASLMLTARAEEPPLTETYGTPYRHYAARTGRFIPGVGLRSCRRRGGGIRGNRAR